MAHFVAVPLQQPQQDKQDGSPDERPVALFQVVESDLVGLHCGAPDIGSIANIAAGRLEAIAEAASGCSGSLRLARLSTT